MNSYITGDQLYPAAASTHDGRFVVVWQSHGSPGSDSSDASIQARRFGPDGTPAAPDAQVNTYTTNGQARPKVAVDGAGGFVVTWSSSGSSGNDSSAMSVQARRFQANGEPQGADLQVNTYTQGDQWAPDAAVRPDGALAVVWYSQDSPEPDVDDGSIQVRRFDSASAPLSPQSQVNSYGTSFQAAPVIAMDEAGNFVIAWQSYGSLESDDSYWSIQAQRFAADGTILGSQFQVNSFTSGSQIHPAIAADSAGNFVVAWQSSWSSGSDSSQWSVQARRFEADGLPIGAEFQVNTYTTYDQIYPSVALGLSGSFLVTWTSSGSSGNDDSYSSIQARLFEAASEPASPEFQVNSYTTHIQWSSTAAGDGRGHFLVAWRSSGSFGNDGESSSIQARRYFYGLFHDGFETGDPTRWSLVVSAQD